MNTEERLSVSAEPIEPETVVVTQPGYAPGHGNYQARCEDVDHALVVARERIEEWDREADPHGWWYDRSVLIALHNAALRRPTADATLDDIATAVATIRVLAVRLEALATVLVDDDPMVRAGWGEVIDDLRKRVVRDGNALFYAHQREAGAPPPRYLSTSSARRCRFMVTGPDPDAGGVLTECGKPSGWRSLAPGTAAARYACETHEADLRALASASGARMEQLPR